MFQRDSYQVFDRSPISSVTIHVEHSSNCSRTKNESLSKNCVKSIFDVNDFVHPAIENSAVSITTRKIDVEFVLRRCDSPENENDSMFRFVSFHRCDHPAQCILPGIYRFANKQYSNISKLCWFESTVKQEVFNYPALDYVLFIRHFIEFPQLSLVRHNLMSQRVNRDYIRDCEFDPKTDPICPKFRLSKILKMIENDENQYSSMFLHGSLIEIKINWKCNLDRSIDHCEPIYEFRRRDLQPYNENPFEAGSSFLIWKHFFRPDGEDLTRMQTRLYNIRIIVSVTGEAGRFDLFQTTTSIGSFLGIFGTGSIVCDLLAGFIRNFHRVKYEQ